MEKTQRLQMDFTGKQIWVTGAGRGIGEQIARAFIGLGAEVVGFDREFSNADLPYHCELLDIQRPEQVKNVCQQRLDQVPRLDVLVNAAGILRLGEVEMLSDDDWHQCLNVNAAGAFYLFRAVIPHFKRQRRGAIVTVGSNAAHVPRMQMAAYCASKAALTSLNHCVALELAEYGVRCNLVSPGSTDTAMLRNMWCDASGEQQTIRGFPERYKLGIPLGKIARAEDIANTVVFLASELASHITMQDIVVDGGATLAV
ncbi:2,3-dihydro-2,3-dihydroxybenzoate dehydrogenase [Brenneria goodwinii]|uniref:2,3-dihydro-2,3-dihydroxybenzoate dehydrogenase n=1 Tax=Brenneria goodwinii TaxID=1109412 RepID=UPI000EF26653|nr:2,3-dihydro-2,3-dihydroxybenzoate dehydrogenase [Brenneria goodwinii]MCG8154647.1 2,3-dihydro-2,3-dihydroxybenzoate dehydrogenase [Brenneria goodwinii]MCG8160017.1 2,3-dihydro-2,3-dihydroxybenzoate dehydrogenase [Brenneria goodwinii]MCG8163885.1 2,3-dihydro-2,3-dihydroxybenzoate dehydrogenase [Brenneria goodwinii]MCG8168494.1 2,3-dihydro-2,3-dihydroxybenzoate dehydrogenase [Brenneria goodwinii]MCG8173951.1 2,3-dihydro-2,3-dihydroxybenzoate dehydrogenase [Brenneria goodwinii]